MFISNFGGDPVTQFNLKTFKQFNEVAPSSDCDCN